MKVTVLLSISFFLISFGYAETNSTNESNLTKKNLEEQMKRESKYAKEKAFYHGKDYNLSETEIDQKSISSIPVIPPEDDFDMDDVYSDIQ
jgi:hypothetical protein